MPQRKEKDVKEENYLKNNGGKLLSLVKHKFTDSKSSVNLKQ